MATQPQKCQQQHQTQHRTGDEGQGELGEQLAQGLEDEELNETLDHGLSVDSLRWLWGRKTCDFSVRISMGSLTLARATPKVFGS
jgi:hypothetical protein